MEIEPRTDRLADFGTSIQLAVVNHPTTSLGDQCCHSVGFGSCSCWFCRGGVVRIPASGPEQTRNSMLGSDCGKVICCSIASDTGGPSSPRVRHVHPVRRSLKQPSASGRSCATPLLPGVRYWSRFCCSRLWNRSVFMVFVQDEQYLETGRDHLCQRFGVRFSLYSWRPDCRWSPLANPQLLPPG